MLWSAVLLLVRKRKRKRKRSACRLECEEREEETGVRGRDGKKKWRIEY